MTQRLAEAEGQCPPSIPPISEDKGFAPMSQKEDRREPFGALKNGDWFDFAGNRQPKCPHCGADFDIAANEAWFLYDENDTHEVECPACEREFEVNSSASWCFSTDDQEASR